MGDGFQSASNREKGNSMPDIAKLPELAREHIAVSETTLHFTPGK